MLGIKKVSKHWTAAIVNTSNLAVNNGIFKKKVLRDPCGKLSETTEDISVSGDQLRFAGFDVRQGAEAINLQFKDVQIGVKRLRTAEADGA